MNQDLKNKILEEFDEKFTCKKTGETGFVQHFMAKDEYANPRTIKDFLSQSLDQAYNSAIEDAIKAVPEEQEYQCVVDKIGKDGDDDKYHFVGHSQTKGFNSCQEQVIKNLEGLKKND